MSEAQPQRCVECGSDLPGGLPAGLCPVCVLGDGTRNIADQESPSAPGNAALPPCSFGDYELLEEIARGGMGVVFKARQRSLDRLVAVKMILAGPLANPELVRRFRSEGLAAGRLQHPHIVTIHEVGVRDGRDFMVMDFVDGPNLATLVREQPLPVERAARLMEKIALAVHAAHERGVLHRDLKPSNVLLAAGDDPRVTDFGLARQLDGDSSLTLSGQILGSPNYMPPEQASVQTDKVSRRSDVYGLGAILYHLVTGRPPFQGATIADTVHQVLHHEPAAPRVVNANVPADMETICLKCLEKEPGRRYATASDVAEELARFRRGEPILARPVTPPQKVWRWSRRHPAVAALVVLLHLVLAAGLAGVLSQWRRAEQHAHRSEREQHRAEAAAHESQLQRVEDLLAQGQAASALAHLAQVVRRDPSNEVAATRLVSVLSQRSFGLPLAPPLRHDGPVTFAEFSPDGAQVVTASADGTARLWDARTGAAAGAVMRHGAAHSMVPNLKGLPTLTAAARFSRDGLQLVTVSGDKFARVWDARTGAPLFTLPEHKALVRLAEFSADGRRLVTVSADNSAWFWERSTNGFTARLLPHGGEIFSVQFSRDGARFVTSCTDRKARVWNGTTGAAEVELPQPSEVQSAEFSPDGAEVLTACYYSTAQVWSLGSLRERLSIRPSASVVEWAAFSPDGQFFATVGRDRMARLWHTRTGKPWLSPLEHYTIAKQVEFSPDGQRLLVTCWDNTAWVWNAREGSLVCEPLRHDGRVNAARFSPDGERVVTASSDGTAMLWDVRPGEQLVQRLRHRGMVVRAEFSPDGGSLATSSYDGTSRVWAIDTGEAVTEPMRLGEQVEWARFDRTGRNLITSGDGGAVGIWDPQSGRLKYPLLRFGGVAHYAEFSQEGTRFLVVSTDGNLRVGDTATGATLLTLKHAGLRWHARFSPDGRRIVSISRRGDAQVWDSASGRAIGPRLRHQSELLDAGFSPDGTRVLTAGQDMTARIWETETGRLAVPPLKHFADVHRARFSPDGRLVLTVSDDTTARLWDAASGRPMGEPMRHAGEVRYGEFSPDGRRVVTVTPGGVARVWDVATCLPVSEPLSHPAFLAHATFSPDGQWLATGAQDRQARLWELPPVFVPAPAWLPALAEAVAGLRRAPAGGTEPVGGEELIRLRDAWRDAPATNAAARWARWFFADRGTRAITPHSGRSVPQFTEQRVAEGTEDSLLEALRVQPRHPLALAQLARLKAGRDTNADSSLELTERITKEGMERSPAGDPPSPARTNTGPGTGYWAAQGWLLERTGLTNEALLAYAQAIDTAPTNTAAGREARSSARLKRGSLLLKAGLTNEAIADLLAARAIPPRPTNAPAACVDLSLHYNAALHDDWHGRQFIGNNLATLPAGLLTLDGVNFDVRGIIQLGSKPLEKYAPGYPPAVSNIVAGLRCEQLDFLHATGWGGVVSNGTHIGSYVIHYEDGQTAEVPLRNGKQVLEWQGGRAGNLPDGRIAWRGTDGRGNSIRLYHTTWLNPRPAVRITTLDYVSTRTDAAPFVVAITAE